MGRRKKEPRSVHRENIVSAASALFMERGIAATSMDDIAKAAGYSKATLYVYFENKEEIVGILVLNSMKKLDDYISSALIQHETTKARYDFICRGLVQYQEEFPFYFKMVLDKINIDFESKEYLPEEKETYQIGEEINEKIKDFLLSGMEKGDLRSDLEIMPAILNFWGMLSGIIQLAANKEEYIKKSMGLSKIKFLEYGFSLVYHSIATKG
ncbi:TetR family transcriptional regulator [Enterocloster clostridioformis]|uniref:TetR/AcrR family transcriptional regulator n=1 Tax=Enterocloster clostridioformis TaxID=1531 RepID=UPI00080CA33E|nr:TetR/AcrR family transcriptional regulator [Enterocloster clostridioformis]ANU45515.1 TetR family transcriptional regulator [Lachnoclostridium sp. YL32]NDO27282.1 TetR/AcrR family transcriptional regulator [Enterocloster clostridioformis]OXE61571.1 TetR family transcriptional regulator [Enterocloster clostridioformis]QQQ99731.1 TetR/AcrR family transcriptional regulator [Enterocloster clostridioformis]